VLVQDLNIQNGMVTKKGEIAERFSYQGLPIAIENPEGSVRRWKNNAGETGKTTIYYKYGYLEYTKSPFDGEEIDCFVGKNPYASNVYIIKLGIDDKEEKVFLGFSSKEEARDAFLAHYNTQKAFGDIIELPMYLFKDMIEFGE